MRKKNISVTIAFITTVGLALSACTSGNNEPLTPPDNNEVTETVEPVKEVTEVTEQEPEETDVVTELGITGPKIFGDLSTWDCIWFGSYWQNTDSDGDGTVTKADEKDPIKWRILDIDEEGNAFLLSDKLLDITEYNPGELEVTWEKSAFRSFLNSYDASNNDFSIDYSADGFLSNAFTGDEASFILTTAVVNEDNPIYGTEGGNDTKDKIFNLSVSEAINPAYGFFKTEFVGPDESEQKFYTEEDSSRVALTTAYADTKGEGFNGTATDRCAGLYWLRTSGFSLKYPGHVNLIGGAYAVSVHMDENRVYLRPAMRINLNDSYPLWSYAGKVSSDGSVKENVSEIKTPVIQNDVSTWNCIWFGSYWQDNDTNGDGTVTEKDEKEPIKWRVLTVDDEGNALVLADKNIDIIECNPGEIDITWETCIFRSYLNGYDASQNVFGNDYSDKGFINNAFTDAEIEAIETTKVVTPDNPVYKTEGGNDTEDKLFCLSVEETREEKYGFMDNELSEISPIMDMWLETHDTEGGDHTPDNPSRVAITTRYTDTKEYNFGDAQLKETDRSPSVWWLRSPGYNPFGGTTFKYPGHVNGGGSSYAISIHMDDFRVGLRPALWINLNDHQDLWSYAGTVSSDDTVYEVPYSLK